MLKIIADSAIPFLDEALGGCAELIRVPASEIDSSLVKGADALVVRTRTRCSEALLKGSSIKMLLTATIGFDHIDIDYCAARGIDVRTSAGCNARGVLQWVSAVLANYLKSRGMTPSDVTLGVVGVGHVGSLIKEYAEYWGFRVLCCDPPRQRREGLDFVDIDTIARSCNVVTFHTPLDDTTHHLCSSEFLSLTSPETLIINSSRGGVVDNEALLLSGRDCALDVWEREPELNRELLAKSIFSTPHIAGYSLQGKANATSMVVEALSERFGLNLKGWYPSSVRRTQPRYLSWMELQQSISQYFDIEKQSLELKQSPDMFERMRDSYSYREEYF